MTLWGRLAEVVQPGSYGIDSAAKLVKNFGARSNSKVWTTFAARLRLCLEADFEGD